MPRQTVTPIVPKGPFISIPVSATALDFAFAASIAADNAEFVATGRDLLLAFNNGITPREFELLTVESPRRNRKADILAYTVGAGLYMAIWLGAMDGIVQSDGKIYINSNHLELEFAVLTLPASIG